MSKVRRFLGDVLHNYKFCPICGEVNPPGNINCKKCWAPI
jgi:ribosomal protein L40E